MTAQEHTATGKSVLLAIMLTCVGYACYNVGDVCLKFMVGRFHYSQIFVTNAACIIAFMAVYGWRKEGKKAFWTKKPLLMMMRALLSLAISFCNFKAIPNLPLTTFYTLVFTSPFWVALLAAWFLKDKLNRERMAVILGGFAVIVFMFRPGSGLLNVWGLLALLSGFLYAGQMVLVRYIGSGESRSFLIMFGSLVMMTAMAPILYNHYVPPTAMEWGMFLLMGLTGSIGGLCIMYAFQAAPSAAIVAPYHYTQIVWGAILGYLCFSEVPKTEVMIGAALIILSGIYLIHIETKRYAGTLKPLKS